MQTARPRLEAGHRKATCAATRRALAGRVHGLAIFAIEKAWVALGEPSPMAGFALLVLFALGRGLLRLPAARVIVDALARAILLALAALTFLFAADRQGQARGAAAAINAKRPPFILQALCNINRLGDSFGYHSAGSRPQCIVQHQPRRTS